MTTTSATTLCGGVFFVVLGWLVSLQAVQPGEAIVGSQAPVLPSLPPAETRPGNAAQPGQIQAPSAIVTQPAVQPAAQPVASPGPATAAKNTAPLYRSQAPAIVTRPSANPAAAQPPAAAAPSAATPAPTAKLPLPQSPPAASTTPALPQDPPAAQASPRRASSLPLITIAEAKARMFRRDVADRVRVRGTVTFTNHRLGIAYVQDSSGGIGYDPRSRPAIQLPAPGDTVEVEGYLTRRQGLAMILSSRATFGPPKITLIPEEKSTFPALPFDLDDAAQLRLDGHLARVSGVIRRISVPPLDGAPMLVEISTPSGYAIARLPWREPQAVLDKWLDCPVTLTAVLVCRADPPLLPEDASALLLVAYRTRWSPQPRALEEAFSSPPITALSAIQATPRTNARQRIHLQGTVTAARARSWVCLRTEDGSIEVTTRQLATFLPGQRLAIAGWPQNVEGRLTLQDGICRPLGNVGPPAPIHLEQGFFHPRMQRELVSLTGILHTHTLPGGLPRHTLALPSGVHCHLIWQTFLRPAQMQHLQEGSTIQLTGICHIHSPTGNTATGADDAAPTLSIIPRSLTDIALIQGPSWWTPDRLTLTVWLLTALAGLALPGALIFRWQLWRQARHIREIESHAAAEEERLRIAREFHDSLQQQLSSAALHLETLKGAVHAAPDMLPRLIDDTTAMLRHCQVEARHTIWDLRSETTLATGLPAALQNWLENRVQPGTSTRIHFTQEGPDAPLPEGVPFQLMRIVQEAVHNSLTHASARTIRVHLSTIATPPQVRPARLTSRLRLSKTTSSIPVRSATGPVSLTLLSPSASPPPSAHSPGPTAAPTPQRPPTAPHLHLLIQDDGTGFDPRLLSHPPPGHYGLAGLKERAAKIRAHLEITTHPQTGTRISLRLPLSLSSHAATH
ncbi:MAG: histidine kinase [Verrucomicrobiota bacterium]